MDNTLRKLQLTQLEILKAVDQFCKENDIRYSLCGGTLLGAIRHKGFIPWDDDVDICMTREYYNLFLRTWSEKKPEGYLLQNAENTPQFSQSFTKIRKEHTTFLQEADAVGAYHVGIFIDIFPVDRMPKQKLRRMLVQMQYMLYQLYLRGYVPKDANVVERIASKVLLCIVPQSGRQGIRNKLLRQITRYNDDASNRVYINASISTIHALFPPDLMDDYTEVSFEDCGFMSVKDWDVYLTQFYGDYMTPPPEHERTGIHNAQIIDFERDYDEYVAMKKQTETGEK